MAQCGAFVGTMMDKTDQYLFYLSGKLIPPIGNKRGLLLIKAIKENNSKKAKSLIEQGTNINIQDDDGCTPLYWAVRYNVTDIVDLLLKKGANIEVQDKYGLTPLHYAVQERLTEIVNLLLDHNAQTDTKSGDSGSTPLHRATVVMNEADRTPEGIQTRQEIIHSLLKKDADIDAVNNDGRTPLHNAVRCPHQEAIVLSLLERGTKSDIKNNEGKTPLDFAKRKLVFKEDETEPYIIYYLIYDLEKLSYKAKVLLLIKAIKKHNTEEAKKLIQEGANIHLRDEDGLTPLCWAVQERLTEIVNLLLDHNAQTDTKSNNGSTPLHRATVVMNEADRTPEGIQTRQEIIHSLLNQGADINARDGFGCTPLHYAVQYLNQEAIVLLLLERDAKIDIKNNEGKTPLGLAKIEYDLKKLLDIAKKQESPDVIRIKNDLIPG
jgi:ankyrin repeat protein